MSELKLFSLGIVLEDKPQEDDYIIATPIEHLSIQDNGDLTKQMNSIKGNIPSLTNDGNQSFTTEHLVTNKIKAKWISFGVSNRETAPDVCRGETVILFRYGEVDEYYWTTLFREPLLRKQETVLYTYSNQKSVGSSYDPQTSYWTRIDTRNKKVQWHTSNNDGELTTYDSILDTKNGLYVTFQDGHNNFSVLNSKEDTYQLNVLENIRINDKGNSEFININHKNNDITISSTSTIGIFAGYSITMRASFLYIDIGVLTDFKSANLNSEVPKKITYKWGDFKGEIKTTDIQGKTFKEKYESMQTQFYDYTIAGLTLNEYYNKVDTTVDTVYNIETNTLIIKAEKILINSPIVEFTGDVIIDGNLILNGDFSVKGKVNLGGGGSINGDLTINGGINASGNVNAPNIKD